MAQRVGAQPLHGGNGRSVLRADLELRAQTTETIKLYHRATFCLQPAGDGLTRKGIVDALTVGCIPVVFHSEVLKAWRWHWGSWAADATVTFDVDAVVAGKLDVVAELARLPEARVVRMQRVIARHARRMQYASSDEHRGDAFEAILQGMWQRERTHSAVHEASETSDG